MPRSILISIKYPNTHWRESIRLVGFFSGSKFKARRIRKYTFSTPPRPRITFLRRWNPGITRSWETDAKPTICCVYRIASCLLLRIRRFNNFFVTCCMQILYGTLYVFIHPEFSLMAHEAKFVNKLLEVLYMRVIHFSFFFLFWSGTLWWRPGIVVGSLLFNLLSWSGCSTCTSRLLREKPIGSLLHRVYFIHYISANSLHIQNHLERHQIRDNILKFYKVVCNGGVHSRKNLYRLLAVTAWCYGCG
jgi:hypothetical protein